MRADDYGIRRQRRLNVKDRSRHTNAAAGFKAGVLAPSGAWGEKKGAKRDL